MTTKGKWQDGLSRRAVMLGTGAMAVSASLGVSGVARAQDVSGPLEPWFGKGGKSAGAIVGFANMLLRLYEAEQPRAIIVGWDTLDVPRIAAPAGTICCASWRRTASVLPALVRI